MTDPLRELTGEELVEICERTDTAEEKVDAVVAILKERARDCGCDLTEYVKAVQDGDDPALNVPKVPWARTATYDTVGPECRAYLKRPDVLKEMGVSYRMVESVLKRLAEKDPELNKLDPGDNDILNRVRDIWRQRYDAQTKDKKRRRLGVAANG